MVVRDIGLPGLDGFGVAGEWPQNPTTAKARPVADTGYAGEEGPPQGPRGRDRHPLGQCRGPDRLPGLVGPARTIPLPGRTRDGRRVDDCSVPNGATIGRVG